MLRRFILNPRFRAGRISKKFHDSRKLVRLTQSTLISSLPKFCVGLDRPVAAGWSITFESL